MSETQKFKYFSCKEGAVVPRYGTSAYIGALLEDGGWKWDTKKVVPIPESEYFAFYREYSKAVKSKVIVEKTKEQYEQYLKSLPEEKTPKKKDGGKKGTMSTKSSQNTGSEKG